MGAGERARRVIDRYQPFNSIPFSIVSLGRVLASPRQPDLQAWNEFARVRRRGRLPDKDLVGVHYRYGEY